MFQSSAGDKPRPLLRLEAGGDITVYVSILGRGQAPAARAPHCKMFGGHSLFQSSAGDKPRPLMRVFEEASEILGFNPRPGTSPGRSQRYRADGGLLPVSILGRGQAPAARLVLQPDALSADVSILGRGQAPAAPRAIFLRGHRTLSFNPRPGTSPGRSRHGSDRRTGLRVSILGRGQAPAAQAISRSTPTARCFNPRPGTSPGRSSRRASMC